MVRVCFAVVFCKQMNEIYVAHSYAWTYGKVSPLHASDAPDPKTEGVVPVLSNGSILGANCPETETSECMDSVQEPLLGSVHQGS